MLLKLCAFACQFASPNGAEVSDEAILKLKLVEVSKSIQSGLLRWKASLSASQ
jgi:hypothetical protein